MKTTILLWLTILNVNAIEFKFFNPEVLGKPIGSCVSLFLEGANGIEPTLVQTDIKKGKFYAATVKYSTKATLAEAREALNKLYSKWQSPNFSKEPTMGLWRNDEKKIAIQLTQHTEEIQIIYYYFSNLK